MLLQYDADFSDVRIFVGRIIFRALGSKAGLWDGFAVFGIGIHFVCSNDIAVRLRSELRADGIPSH